MIPHRIRLNNFMLTLNSTSDAIWHIDGTDHDLIRCINFNSHKSGWMLRGVFIPGHMTHALDHIREMDINGGSHDYVYGR